MSQSAFYYFEMHAIFFFRFALHSLFLWSRLCFSRVSFDAYYAHANIYNIYLCFFGCCYFARETLSKSVLWHKHSKKGAIFFHALPEQQKFGIVKFTKEVAIQLLLFYFSCIDRFIISNDLIKISRY